MDWLITILEKFKVLLTTVVTVIPLAIIFRKQIAELIASITSIEIDPKKRRWKVSFGQRVQQVQVRATGIREQVTASRAVPVALPVVEGATQASRDMVIEAWAAVKQVVYDACIANKIAVTPAMGVQEAARRLGNAKTVSSDLVKLIEIVYELGQEVAKNTRLRPQPDDARTYWTLAYDVVNLMWLSALAPKEPIVSPKPPPRATVVGADFVPPRQGSPAATLIGISGPMRGQKAAIDKPHYRIGRNPNNDLRVAGDDSVSGNHAYLRYDKGSLLLFDQGSLNGTFLNEQRVTGAPLVVRQGDRIRVGESVFEVSQASASAKPIEGKLEAAKGPLDRSIVR
jgi:hypothetical protein